MTLKKLAPTLGLAIKAGKVMRVGWGEYALTESGLTPYIPPKVNIAKHRHGPVDTVELFFDPELTRFSCVERRQCHPTG
jgi:hypothetical protein